MNLIRKIVQNICLYMFCPKHENNEVLVWNWLLENFNPFFFDQEEDRKIEKKKERKERKKEREKKERKREREQRKKERERERE